MNKETKTVIILWKNQILATLDVNVHFVPSQLLDWYAKEYMFERQYLGIWGVDKIENHPYFVNK